MNALAHIAVALVLGQTPAPVPPSPSDQASTQSAQPSLPVLTLEDALREAQAKNLDVKQAFARLDQANQASAKAWSYYLPQLSGNITYTRNEDQSIIPSPPFPAPVVLQKEDQLNASLKVTQALIAPALWPAIKNAYRSERLAATNVESARRDILFGVVQLYYGAAGLKQAVTVQVRQLVIASNHERDARVRYQAGTSPKVALLRAEIDRAKAEQDLKRAQNAYLSTKVQLATMLDRNEADFEVEVPAARRPPADGAQMEESALRDRPDVLAAQQSLELTQGQRTGVWAQYFPSLGAFGQLNWANLEGFAGKQTSWALGLSLTWNIFDGTLREANLRESQARVAEAEYAQESTRLKAREDVRRSLLDLDSALANKATGKEQVDLARENEKLIEVNYRAGAATYIEVADAQAALLSAELNYVAVSLDADLATVRLQKAVGAFRGAGE
jgi:outer membrane protein TolC